MRGLAGLQVGAARGRRRPPLPPRRCRRCRQVPSIVVLCRWRSLGVWLSSVVALPAMLPRWRWPARTSRAPCLTWAAPWAAGAPAVGSPVGSPVGRALGCRRRVSCRGGRLGSLSPLHCHQPPPSIAHCPNMKAQGCVAPAGAAGSAAQLRPRRAAGHCHQRRLQGAGGRMAGGGRGGGVARTAWRDRGCGTHHWCFMSARHQPRLGLGLLPGTCAAALVLLLLTPVCAIAPLQAAPSGHAKSSRAAAAAQAAAASVAP